MVRLNAMVLVLVCKVEGIATVCTLALGEEIELCIRSLVSRWASKEGSILGERWWELEVTFKMSNG